MQCPRVVLNLPASLFAILGNVPRGILSTPRSAIANHTSLMFSRLVNSHSAASQGICHRGPVCLSVRFLAQHETTGNNYKQENMGHPADSFCLVSAGFVPSSGTERAQLPFLPGSPFRHFLCCRALDIFYLTSNLSRITPSKLVLFMTEPLSLLISGTYT